MSAALRRLAGLALLLALARGGLACAPSPDTTTSDATGTASGAGTETESGGSTVGTGGSETSVPTTGDTSDDCASTCGDVMECSEAGEGCPEGLRCENHSRCGCAVFLCVAD
ncbi:MAG: hypothetical protein H6713_29760 [Myxococcales bacterium]|nr:hypothetical protein [Myxococcales bacterium]MCB9754149.1 hypothetical protein [Myxococcales bacterium]